MAIRKTGSRRITIDGVEYRWRIAPRPTIGEFDYAGSMVASVQLAETPGQVLFVACGLRHGNILGAPGAVVTPRQIAETIRAAIAAGWTPAQPGPVFRIVLSPVDRQV
jgi:hypothetical protein